MNIYDLPTPTVLLDSIRLRNNIKRVFDEAERFQKKVWPMVKTHKSTFIAVLQREYGADGFTVGTLDEAEVLAERGIAKTLMCGNVYIADKENLERVARIAERGVRIILRLDNVEAAAFINNELEKRGIRLEYVVKVDTGLHRFGVPPKRVTNFIKALERFRNLEFVGIVTHPGHVYACTDPGCVARVAGETSRVMSEVLLELRRSGYDPEIVGTGSTPTLRFDLGDPTYTHLFPGNFVYYDRLQVELYGSAEYNDCALTVLVTVVSIPENSEGKFAIINAGSKYFALDRGGHGVEAIKGYGRLVEHPRALVTSLSEEVGKVDMNGELLRVGEKTRVIPNHACIVGNSTSYLVACEGSVVKGLVKVDMRNGTRIPETLLKLSSGGWQSTF